MKDKNYERRIKAMERAFNSRRGQSVSVHIDLGGLSTALKRKKRKVREAPEPSRSSPSPG